MPLATNPDVAYVDVKIGGQAISNDMRANLTDVLVENDLYLPDIATIKFHLDDIGDGKTDIPDKTVKDYLSQGKEVELLERRGDDSNGKTIFKGEITSVSLEYSYWEAASPMLAVVQASDKSHRLHRGRNTKTYLKQKYSDIAKKVAGNHSLSPKVDATSGVMDYVLQANQTDWEFLWQLADRVGYELYVTESELHFEKPQKSPGTAVELNWGEELLQFRTRASTALQIPKVVVRGWDPAQQKAIMGDASSGKGGPSIGESKTGYAQAKSAFGDSQIEIVNMPVKDQAEAKGIAEGLANAIATDHINAEGILAEGMGEILPRKMVNVKGVGTQYSGKYYVTATTHHWTGWGGFQTTFIVGGRKSNTLAELTGGGRTSLQGNTNVTQGVVPAVVTNNEDEDDLGRVKVKFPWLNDGSAEVESDWARIATPDAGPTRGIMWMPEVNDEVLVAFEHGDVNRPYVIGSLWSAKNKPPMKNSEVGKSKKINQRVIQSRAGHVIILNDEQGKEQIVIRDKTKKNEIVIDSKANTFTLKVDKDVTIDAGGKVDIKGAQAISINSAQQDVNIDCNNFNVNAKQKCTIKGNAGINVETTAQMNLKGTQATLEATARAEMKGNAGIAITSPAITQIRGSLVQIN